MIKEIAFTGYPTTNMTKARAFYENVLGLKPSTEYGDQWVEYEVGHGGWFAVHTFSPEPPSGNRGMIAFEVDDLEATIETLKAAGFPPDEPYDSPVCRMAMVKDPDGNSVCIHKRKDAA